MSIQHTIDPALVRQWVAAKHGPEDIRNLLYALGHDESSIEQHLTAWKRMRNAARQWQGFVFMGAGALLGFFSCVMSLINPIPEMNGIFLYGCTSIAVLMAFAGLFFVFE
jgi:hypothetical protein